MKTTINIQIMDDSTVADLKNAGYTPDQLKRLYHLAFLDILHETAGDAGARYTIDVQVTEGLEE